MNLSSPFIITPRLLAGLQIGGAFISIEYSKRPGERGRTRYTWHIDIGPDEHSGSDLQSGCQGGTLQEGMVSLLDFLSAAGESYGYRMRTGRTGENEELFSPAVVEWAYQHQDEITMLRLEIEENPVPLLVE